MFEGIKNYTSQDSIIVLHDFFIDRIVSIGSKVKFFQAIEEKTKSGGGSIRGVSSLDVKGGNAVNVAYCLAEFRSTNLFIHYCQQNWISYIRKHIFKIWKKY